MERGHRRRFALACATLTIAAAPAAATAQEPFTWENATELSFVSTGGNASASSLGLKATLSGSGGAHAFKIEAGGIRSETEITTRFATGSAASPTIVETTESQLTAENYFFRGRYDRTLDGAFGYAGAGWERNTFAGVQNRYSVVLGLGRTFVDGDSGRLKADIGGTYTIQKDVDPAPGADDDFLGARLTVEAKRTLSASTDYTSELVVDENLETTDDLRADWINSVSVSLSERLALKTSLQLLYDAQPAQLAVPLLNNLGQTVGQVLTPGEKLDNILTLTLVIKL